MVHTYLQKRYPLRQIAEIVNVSLDTVKKDKAAIAKSLSAEHVEVKALDLDDLDSMERECLEQLDTRLKEMTDYVEGDSDEPMNPKVLKVMYDSAGKWWERRLQLKQLRGKWLGFEVKTQETETGAVVVDNSIHVTVNAPNQEKEQSFSDYVKGFMPELPDIDGKIKELPPGEEENL